jgi:hypothetical protein
MFQVYQKPLNHLADKSEYMLEYRKIDRSKVECPDKMKYKDNLTLKGKFDGVPTQKVCLPL